MNSFFKFTKFFNPYKFTTNLMFGSFMTYAGYKLAYQSPYTDYLKDIIEAKPANQEFLNDVRIISGNSNPALAQEIAQHLGTELLPAQLKRFADGECNIQVLGNVRGKDIFVIQPTCPPVNENLMELLLLVSALRRASARKVNVVVPYYGYCRQDRKSEPRVPISAADVARLMQTMGVDRLIAVDLHCGQIQGFFGPDVPVDNLEANVAAVSYFLQSGKFKDKKSLTVVSPDAGGVARAKKFQSMLRHGLERDDIGLAMIIKHRAGPNKIAEMHLVGQVENSDIIVVDDLIDTAGTLKEASRVLKEKGANRVFCFATHGLFSGKAFENIETSKLEEVVTTNTIPPRENEARDTKKIQRLSVAPLLAEAIRRAQSKESVSNLFLPTFKK